MASGSSDEDRMIRRLDEIVRILAILAGRGQPQAKLIVELDKAGLEPKRIAEIVGTTRNTVNVTLHAARKKR